jgi:hypothetical protein
MYTHLTCAHQQAVSCLQLAPALLAALLLLLEARASNLAGRLPLWMRTSGGRSNSSGPIKRCRLPSPFPASHQAQAPVPLQQHQQQYPCTQQQQQQQLSLGYLNGRSGWESGGSQLVVMAQLPSCRLQVWCPRC